MTIVAITVTFLCLNLNSSSYITKMYEIRRKYTETIEFGNNIC
jgi:hypothetical protein